MSFVILHHAPLGRNLDPHSTEQVVYLMTYLDFMDGKQASGKYIGGKLQFDEALDPEFEINIFRFQEDHIHNEKLYLLFEVGMSLQDFTATQGPMWDRVMKQVHFHRASGAGDVVNIYEAGNTIVFVMQRSVAMEKVVTAQMRSEFKAV
jgi:hypothetical protein